MVSKQRIRTRYLGHVTGFQPIRDQYFQYWSVPEMGAVDSGGEIGGIIAQLLWRLNSFDHFSHVGILRAFYHILVAHR